jgi:hypothetical protein
MPKIIFTAAMDQVIYRLRGQGYAWLIIAADLDVAESVVLHRARKLGFDTAKHYNIGPIAGPDVVNGVRHMPIKRVHKKPVKQLTLSMLPYSTWSC